MLMRVFRPNKKKIEHSKYGSAEFVPKFLVLRLNRLHLMKQSSWMELKNSLDLIYNFSWFAPQS